MASMLQSGINLHRTSAALHHQLLPCLLDASPKCFVPIRVSQYTSKSFRLSAANTLTANSVPSRNGVYTVGDFMTTREELHVVKPTTSVDEALDALVEHRITGFPVIDDNWKLVGLVSDYDLLALDSVSGTGRADAGMFPEVDSNWKGSLFPAVPKLEVPPHSFGRLSKTAFSPSNYFQTFNEVQKLLSKTNGKVVGDLMTPAPLVVRESTNLEDAARLLLKTKYRRLPVVDGRGKLVGIITRGNVVRAALQIKRATEIVG